MLRLFGIQPDGQITEITTDSPTLEQLKQAHWVDALEPTDQERDWLSSVLKTELPESDDVEEIEASARCFVDHIGLHVHALFLAPTEGRHKTVTVACILQKNRLVTIREGEVADFRLLRLRARRGQVFAKSATELLITLLDQKVENHADTLEDIHRSLEDVSYMVLEDDDAELEDAIGQLAKLEDSNGKMRLCLLDTQRDISFMLRHTQRDDASIEMLREINRDIETLMSHTTFLFDKINFLMDSTQGFINIEQNQIIKTFSIAAVVFLPPTLIASIYGMNFEFMPELALKLGYPGALVGMLLSGFAPYWFFKRKGWL
ncbi:magnesium/cobalt transporter CorA [Idiomarina xiamenensis]|uniref:Magnesium transport protein CorA n=1 Tax=Idiomarina xiamenensis 10-D-4 TaxID=740709 RepID=K2JZI0_9GAMM|nr:magnesium/cobalt transporter CorA [Idiomarina xiamenensis]EKE80863.1 magnesium and cobalt transport protein CorA [Idiomarina xiamenensis 10-D-4]